MGMYGLTLLTLSLLEGNTAKEYNQPGKGDKILACAVRKS